MNALDLANRFARSVATAIERAINNATAPRDDDTPGGKQRFALPDRSFKALDQAFRAALAQEIA